MFGYSKFISIIVILILKNLILKIILSSDINLFFYSHLTSKKIRNKQENTLE